MRPTLCTISHPLALFSGGLALLFLLLVFASPVRASLRDGFRCVRRYRTIWGIVSLFGFCYAAFQLALEVYYYRLLPEESRPVFQWSRAWFLPHDLKIEVLKGAILPSWEGLAGLFNILAATYPFSAVAAALLLANWDGHNGVLNRALRKRMGATGWTVYGAILVCAAAAVAKPVMYVVLPVLGGRVSALSILQFSTLVDWLSFLFECLLGACIQLYLILLVYAWVRGLTFSHRHLLDFAIRRLSSVVKWTALVMVASSLLINLPLLLSVIPPFTHWIPPETTVERIDRFSRPLLVAFLLCFSTVQITLTFHSESLRSAIRDHFQFLRRNWWHVAWFYAVAGMQFYLLNVVNLALVRGLGSGTALIVLWRLVYPFIAAFAAAWMLAGWVCLFRRCQDGHPGKDNWIEF